MSRLLPTSIPDFFWEVKQHPNSKVPDNVFFAVKFYVIIVILEIFAGIKYFVSQNKILLFFTDRPALFVKTGFNINESDVQRRMHCMTWKKCIGKKKRGKNYIQILRPRAQALVA